MGDQCEPCTAAWGPDIWPCAEEHDERHQTLAEALAQAFNPWELDEDRLQHVGWFMEDAESIIAQGVEGPPWKVKVITLKDKTKFSVNGRFCVFHDGDKDAPAHSGSCER